MSEQKQTVPPFFLGTAGVFDLGDLGKLQVAPAINPGHCDVAIHRDCACCSRASFYWTRRGKRDVSYCRQHAVETFPEAFRTV